MRKFQTSRRGGIQDFLCPFTDMYITQGSNGAYSHKGTMANDVRGSQAGVRYPYYAPCDVKCIWIYPNSGQACWQSLEKVRFANGNINYTTFMTCHDDSFDAYVDINTYGQENNNTGIIEKVKECLTKNVSKTSKEQFKVDVASFDICKDDIVTDYITKANDNVFTATKYLLDKLFYYSKTIDSMKFIVYDEDKNQYRMLDLAKKETFGNAIMVILSMFKTQLESMAYSSECNLGTVVRFPKTKTHQMLFEKKLFQYDFLN